MSNQPKVCVIIPVFNHAEFLEQSIDSALSQTYDDLEVFIVDDGSDDQEIVKDIALKYSKQDSRIRFSGFNVNHGKWHALNYAIQNTNCQLVTCQDADDTSCPDRIERQVSVFSSVPNTAHVLCGFHHCWSNEDVDKLTPQKTDGPLSIMQHSDVHRLVMSGFAAPNINHYYTGNFETAGTSAMFLRDVWNIGMRFNPPGQGLRVLLSEDSDFNFRVTSFLGKTAVLCEKLYCYRRGTSTNKEEL